MRMWISGASGASYGADIPVKSVVRSSQESDMSCVNSQTFDLASACLLIQTFRVSTFDDRERSIDEYFYKRNVGFFVKLARQLTIGLIWGDERGNCDRACISEQFGYLHGKENDLEK